MRTKAILIAARQTAVHSCITENIRVPQTRKLSYIAHKLLEPNEWNDLPYGVERKDNPRDITISNLLLRTGIRVYLSL